MVKCQTCETDLQPEDNVYQDNYFGSVYCSWKCTVEAMSEFFEVEEGQTIKLKDTN